MDNSKLESRDSRGVIFDNTFQLAGTEFFPSVSSLFSSRNKTSTLRYITVGTDWNVFRLEKENIGTGGMNGSSKCER